MSIALKKDVVLFSGLPYSGKTAIISRLREILPGEAIYVDAHFKRLVSKDEICLERWLEHNARLVESIIEHIQTVEASRYYVEIGIMRKRYRTALIDWCHSAGYRVIPVLLRCDSCSAIAARQKMRDEAFAAEQAEQKIAIDLDELYGPISSAFEVITEDEGYYIIDTSRSIDICVDKVVRLLERKEQEKSSCQLNGSAT